MTISDAVQTEPVQRPLRERILGAAFDAFLQHGYGGASTLDIARRARMSKRDLYAEFGSKQAMLAACIESRAERMRNPLHLPAPRSAAALETTLVTFGRQLLQEVSRPEVLALYRLAVAEAERAPELAQTLDGLGRGGNQAALRELLADAQAAGLLVAGPPDVMAETFLALLWTGGLLSRLLLRVAEPPDDAARQQRALAATDIVLKLYAPVAAGITRTRKTRRSD